MSRKRTQYVAKMKQQLDQVNAKLDEVEVQTKAIKAEARKKYNKQMAELRKLAKSANKQLEELKTASEDKWDGLVAEGEKFENAFVHSYNYFKSQLKQQPRGESPKA